MKKKTKMKNKQKQKQRQSIIVNIDNSRKSIKRDKRQSQSRQQQQQPSVIPQPIYIPQFNYTAPPQPQVFRQEPVVVPPAVQAPALPVTIDLPPPPAQVRGLMDTSSVMTNKAFSSASTPSRIKPAPAVTEKFNNPSSGTPLDNSYYFDEDVGGDTEERTRDFYMPDEMASSTVMPPNTTPVRNAVLSSTCVEIVQSGQRKGQICGRKCLTNSPFCGIHKNSTLDFTRPMERYIRK